MTAREPGEDAGRQAGVTDRTNHAAHEPLDVAAFAAGDLSANDRDRVAHQVAGCADCQALLADLKALATAIHHDPPAIPPRRADFRIDESDVARLANPWRRLSNWLRGPRGAVTRPVAAGLATIGVAAILLASLPTNGPSAASLMAPEAAVPSPASGQMLQSSEMPRDAVGAAAENDAGAAAGSPSAGSQTRTYGADASAATDPSTDLKALAQSDAPGPQPLVVLGVVLIGTAVVVLLARPIARRFG